MTILDDTIINANYLLQTKRLIHDAIINQNVTIPDNALFSDYPKYVASIGNGVNYRQPSQKRNGSITGELLQIKDTKERLREVIIAQGEDIPINTPFRQYATKIGSIIITPTIKGLKSALISGTATIKYPIGTEIEDKWNDKYNPLIIAHYLDETNNSLYNNAEGAILIRKYADPLSRIYDNSNSDYSITSIHSYLQNEYITKCSNELTDNIADINIPYRGPFGLEKINSKFFLMSMSEIIATDTGEGAPFELWKQRTGLSSPSVGSNSGRIITSQDGTSTIWWLRSRYNNSSAYVVYNGGSTSNLSVTSKNSIFPACFISRN